MLNSRYKNKELVEMRSSRSTMSSSRSGSDDFSGYSLITNDHCVSAPRAKVFLVATLSCVIAVIVVVIVVVTKVDEISVPFQENPGGCTFQEMCGNDGGNRCPDYAVVGTGLAGAYAAWKINNLNQSVFLYEATDRIGGKLFTRQFQNVSGVNLEMGLPHFIKKLQPLTTGLIDFLGLTTKKYYGETPFQNRRYFTRRQWTLHSNVDYFSKGYNLAHKEEHYPKDLLRKTLQSAVPFEIPDSPNATRHYSNQQTLRTALLGRLSTEAYRYIQDMMGQLDFQAEANAAQYVEYLNNQEVLHVSDTEDVYTLEDGMMSLPLRLVEESMLNTLSFSYQPNHRLKQIQSKGQAVQLSFVKTVTSEDGSITELEETVETCAKTVILALPPKDLKELIWAPLSKQKQQDALNSVTGIQSHVVYLLYNGTFLANEIQNRSLWIQTDLPIGEVGIFHAERRLNNTDRFKTEEPPVTTNTTNANFAATTTNKYEIIDNNTTLVHSTETPIVSEFIYQPVTVIKAVFSARDYYQYWKSLLDSGTPLDEFSSNIRLLTDVTLEHIHLHLSEVLNMTVSSIPYPLDGYVEETDTNSNTGPMSYIWNPGSEYNWDKVHERLFQPNASQNVFIVGQAFAPSHFNLGIEGDLLTVNKLKFV